MDFEMSFVVVEAIRGRCASFMILTATVSDIFGGQTSSTILVVQIIHFTEPPEANAFWQKSFAN